MKKHYDPYTKIIKKTLDRLIPFTVHWELTYRCNLQCPHCYIAKDRSREELSLREITKILDLLKEGGTLYVIFSGGEILTREDFFEVARYARKKGFALRLLTNGILIDERLADGIKELCPLSVDISLYGSSAVTHDCITACQGSFARSLKALRLLNERGIRTRVKTLIMKQNVREFERIRGLAQGIGSQFLYDPVIIPRMDGSMEPCRYRLNGEELFSLLYTEVHDKELDGDLGEDYLSCSAGLNTLSISPYGDVYPCPGFKESGGNVTKKSLSEILHSSSFCKTRSITLSDLRECKRCQYIRYCNRCPGLAWMETGDLLGASQANCLLAGVIKNIIDDKRDRGVMEKQIQNSIQTMREEERA